MEDDLIDLAEAEQDDSLIIKTSHLCWIYGADEQRLAVVMPFFEHSLARRRRCLLVVADDVAKAITDAADAAGVNVERHLETGQIRVLSPESFFMSGDVFDSDVATARLERENRLALDDQWTGLAIISDASPLFAKINEVDWVKFELELNGRCAEDNCMALCLVDQRQASGSLVTALIKLHPIVGMGTGLLKNPYYIHSLETHPYLN